MPQTLIISKGTEYPSNVYCKISFISKIYRIKPFELKIQLRCYQIINTHLMNIY